MTILQTVVMARFPWQEDANFIHCEYKTTEIPDHESIATHIRFNHPRTGEDLNFDIEKTVKEIRDFVDDDIWREQVRLPLTELIFMISKCRWWQENDWVEWYMTDINVPDEQMHWTEWFLAYGEEADNVNEGHVVSEIDSDDVTLTFSDVTDDDWDPLPLDTDLDNLDLDFLEDYINK